MDENPTEEITKITNYFGEDPQNPDHLHEDLQPYYESEGGNIGWPMLRHPLVYQIPFHSWKMANTQYEVKLKRIEEYTLSGEFERALWFYERPYRMSKLQEWYWKGNITNEQLKEMLPSVWTDTEQPFQYGYNTIVRLFRSTGFLTDVPGLREPVECEVFRGCLPMHKRGISWTLDKDRAKWFAKRLNGDKGRVYRTVAPASIVLAVFNGRDEQEVLLNPRLIKSIEEVSDEDV